MRPLGVGEILDAGIKVVTRHWKPLMASTMALAAPVAAFVVLIMWSIDPEQLELIPEGDTTTADSSSTSEQYD